MRPYRFRRSAPRDYADRLADAMGEGCSGATARCYAGGAVALRHFLSSIEGDNNNESNTGEEEVFDDQD